MLNYHISSELSTHVQPSILGLDAHTRTCTLASINDKDKVVTTKTFSTSEYALIDHIRQVPAKKKSLMVEESSLAGWLTRTLRPHVDTCIVCDPLHNALIVVVIKMIFRTQLTLVDYFDWESMLRCIIASKIIGLILRSL